MQEQIITLSNALDLIYQTDKSGNPVPFSITFWTANTQLKTGGDEITYERAVLHMKVRGKSVNVAKALSKSARNPHHRDNGTMNIRQLGQDRLTTVHHWLIKTFNNKKVVWNRAE